MPQQPQNNRTDKSAHILKYIDTDLLCYRADKPKALNSLQEQEWHPWLDWFTSEFGADLSTTSGLEVLSQPKEAKEEVEKYINQLTESEFDALYGATTISGSIVLGLALVKQNLTAEEAVKLIFLEETYKEQIYDADKYGSDPHIEAKKKEALKNLDQAAALTLARESAKNASASKA